MSRWICSRPFFFPPQTEARDEHEEGEASVPGPPPIKCGRRADYTCPAGLVKRVFLFLLVAHNMSGSVSK